MGIVQKFSILNDTPNGLVAPTKLAQEVKAIVGLTETLNALDTDGDEIIMFFSGDGLLSQADLDAVEAVVNAHDGVPLPSEPKKTLIEFEESVRTPVLGIPKVAIYEAEGHSRTYCSHDFSDKTTWYSQSIRVVDETPSLDSGKTYNLANVNIIDVKHGKITRENTMTSTYEVVVSDNAVLLLEDSDYTVNYSDGKITFDAGYTITGPLLVTYSYENGSCFVLGPAPGKILRLTDSEMQFTKDIEFKPVWFEVRAYNPLDLPNKVVVESTKFNSLKDVINLARRGTGSIPQLPGFNNEIIVFPFKYDRAIDLISSAGMEICVRLDDDSEAMGGEWGTITIYTNEEDEVS